MSNCNETYKISIDYAILQSKGISMKHLSIVTLCAIALLFTACGGEEKESQNSAGTYLDSRTDAMSLAEKSAQESNQRTKEQDKALEALKTDY